jgi:VWFA-related protein
MRGLLASAGVLLASIVLATGAQEPASFRAAVDTVAVYATVRARDGQLARGLTQDDFELFDNGARQGITVFSNGIQRITIAILLDRSGSIGDQAPKVTAAAQAFVRELIADDRASIDSLSWNCQPLTDDKGKLVEMVRGRMPPDIGSPVWAGLDRTMSSLSQEAGRRAILVLSDGMDGGSSASLRLNGLPLDRLPGLQPGPCRPATNAVDVTLGDVSARARREGVMVYAVSVETAVGLTRESDLNMITRDSGGSLARLKQDADLAAAFTRIADELHHQYLLGFVPADFDGKLHTLEVRVKPPGLSVQARNSYVAERADPGGGGANGSTILPAPPLPAASDADVELAIRNGIAGKRLDASCSATDAMPIDPGEPKTLDVIAEGPIGRIMRAAREANDRRLPFFPAQVSADLRAPLLRVTASLTQPQPADGQIAAAAGRPTNLTAMAPITVVRLRSRGPSPTVLRPVSLAPGFATGRPPSGMVAVGTLVAWFDLASFQALPGSDVEVVVSSANGERRCALSARDRRTIR